MTKSSLARESIEEALRKQPPSPAVSCHDLARGIKALPEDLRSLDDLLPFAPQIIERRTNKYLVPT
jgi:hypothetical protein